MSDLTQTQLEDCVAAVMKIIAEEKAGTKPRGYNAERKRELMKGSSDWNTSLFAPYAEERRSRMERLRMAARFTTELYARFGPEAKKRRIRARQRMRDNPEILTLLLAIFSGPENGPDHVFTPEYVEAAFAP